MTASIAPRRRARGWLGLLGPAGLVSVGYLDPGNWATDLEAGARFGYGLLWVLVASNVMALVLQNMSAKLGIVSGLDLASACGAHYSSRVSVSLWLLAEFAIIACDLAELVGSAIALNLLFDVPLVSGALLTGFDVLLLLGLQRLGAGKLEALVVTLLVGVALCLGCELLLSGVEPGLLARGLVPRLPSDSLYIAIGVLGATVMPHNLYLHSGLVPWGGRAPRAIAGILRRSFWSTALALNFALLLNAAILILAAAVFGSKGLHVHDFRDAHRLLTPLLGTSLASLLFALGLLCSGQSATITGTLAGQMVMEGFVALKWPPALRRLVTRGIAIVPAVAVLSLVGDRGAMPLLVVSQVALSLQLPFAIVPLLRLTSSTSLMGERANGPLLKWTAVTIALVIVAANGALLAQTIAAVAASSPALAALLSLLSGMALLLLIWIAVVPLERRSERVLGRTAGALQPAG